MQWSKASAAAYCMHDESRVAKAWCKARENFFWQGGGGGSSPLSRNLTHFKKAPMMEAIQAFPQPPEQGPGAPPRMF